MLHMHQATLDDQAIDREIKEDMRAAIVQLDAYDIRSTPNYQIRLWMCAALRTEMEARRASGAGGPIMTQLLIEQVVSKMPVECDASIFSDTAFVLELVAGTARMIARIFATLAEDYTHPEISLLEMAKNFSIVCG